MFNIISLQFDWMNARKCREKEMENASTENVTENRKDLMVNQSKFEKKIRKKSWIGII